MKKALKLCGLTACCAVMLSSYTCAYIDPSVMTYTIQAIAGVVIAVGAVAGIYWRKAKKKVNEKLGLDENRNKEVESDVLEIKEDDVEPQINVTSSVKEPEMLRPFIVEVIVNTVAASTAVGTPESEQVAAVKVSPAGSAGCTVKSR